MAFRPSCAASVTLKAWSRYLSDLKFTQEVLAPLEPFVVRALPCGSSRLDLALLLTEQFTYRKTFTCNVYKNGNTTRLAEKKKKSVFSNVVFVSKRKFYIA